MKLSRASSASNSLTRVLLAKPLNKRAYTLNAQLRFSKQSAGRPG